MLEQREETIILQSGTTVQVSKNGPYLVKGRFIFVGTDGKEEIKESVS